MRTFILDNYDSFTFNLYQMVARLQGGREPLVFRNDALSVLDIGDLGPDRIILSPGPGHPAHPAYFGVCGEVIRRLGPTVPILGVCLGHLGLIETLGGQVVRAPAPRHGKTSLIRHDGTSVFKDLPDPLEVMRYHSLIGDAESLPGCLRPTAWTDDGVLMAVEHRDWPMVGVQFHPESIGTPQGADLVKTFIEGYSR